MRVFVTGASGFIGSVVVEELLATGHKVLGLVRTEGSENHLKSLGAEVLHGSLEDLESIKYGAAICDGVIHLAFIHNFADMATSAKVDLAVIQTIGAVLEGTN